MIVDGKKIAEEILQELEKERASLPPVLRLGVVMGAGDAASDSFVRIKERTAERLRVDVSREVLAKDSSTTDAIHAVLRLSKVAAGIIVQLPLPRQITIAQVLAALPPEQDVDRMRPPGLPRLVSSPIVGALSEIFVRYTISASGKKAVVVGEGTLVGTPAAEFLRELRARVVVVTEESGSLEELADADLVVLGAGHPGLVTPEMLKPGVVLIDAGTSAASDSHIQLPQGARGRRVFGDADPACANVASVFTPVPGGVGPITVAMLFKNLFALVRHQQGL